MSLKPFYWTLLLTVLVHKTVYYFLVSNRAFLLVVRSMTNVILPSLQSVISL